jgi:hypothetical protein
LCYQSNIDLSAASTRNIIGQDELRARSPAARRSSARRGRRHVEHALDTPSIPARGDRGHVRVKVLDRAWPRWVFSGTQFLFSVAATFVEEILCCSLVPVSTPIKVLTVVMLRILLRGLFVAVMKMLSRVRHKLFHRQVVSFFDNIRDCVLGRLVCWGPSIVGVNTQAKVFVFLAADC